MKRIGSILLTAALILGLAACGGSGGSADGGSSAGSGGSAGGGTAEVVFWHSLGGSVGDELTAIVDEYNAGRGAEQGVHVTPVYQGYDGTDKQILAYQTKDVANACDINVGLTSTIPSMLELGWTTKVSDMYEKYGSYVSMDSFSDALRGAVSYQNEMICLPYLNSTLVLYYNEDLLKAAGFDAPPSTLDELAEYTAALTERDASGAVTRYGFECEAKRYHVTNYIARQSTSAYFGDLKSGREGPMTKVVAGEEGTLKAFLEKWDKLVETGGYLFVEETIREEFANQKTAMAMISSSSCASIGELIGDSFQWGTAMIPAVNASDTGSSCTGGSCLVLFDRGDEARLAGAWDFMQYLSTPDSQYRIATHSGYIPTNKETADLQEMQAFWEEHPQFKTAFDILANGPENAQEPMDLMYNEIDSAISDNMRLFCDRQLTVDQTVDAIVSQCNQLLDEWHEAND